jgi:transcription initiation factor TFIIIB Brf1 subunit/transcription initiation factor TFIIB
MTTIHEWIDAYAEELGVPAPTPEEIDQILQLAAVAARGSARQAAPVACWLAAVAEFDPDEVITVAERVSARLAPDTGTTGDPRE